MMLSDGLVGTLDHCIAHAVQMVRSGPAAAPAAALEVGGGRGELLSMDMGGTSLDVCVIAGGEVPMTRESWVEDERVAAKMVDVHSVGAGGGSIAWIDQLGLLRVGPHSAGSTPGPACYGRGGAEPTVTDADLLLGYLPDDAPLGGQITLDRERADAAVATVGEPLGMGVDEAAQAIFTTVNSFMADQITEVSTRRGHDVRDFTLVAGGGMGPLHAPFIAALLGVETVIVPAMAGTYSAYGMLSMDVGRTYVRTHVARLDGLDVVELERLYAEMEAEARDAFSGGVRLTRTADVRYIGQFSEVEIELPAGAIDLDAAVQRFHRRHQELFTFSMPWKGVELLTLGLRATAPGLPLPPHPGATGAGESLKGRRECWFDGEPALADVYDGERLAVGTVFEGPAIIEESATTVVVPPGFSCAAGAGYVLRRRAAGPRLTASADATGGRR
jgi:N-methylhydantoinase A